MSRKFFCMYEAFALLVDARSLDLMYHKCFRRERLAGSFIDWRMPSQVFEHPIVMQELEDEIDDMIDAGDYNDGETYWVPINVRETIGWSSTAPAASLPESTRVAPFKPNRWTDAYRVLGRVPLAPTTNHVTIVFRLDWDDNRDRPLVRVFNIYPGEACPNGSREEPKTIDPKEAVFFDWNHPGEMITEENGDRAA